MELSALVKQVVEDNEIRFCPHGRPVMIELSKHELEKQFGRV
jgi:DNA mismatch repair protein MutL